MSYFSVIVPVYNVAEYLREALDSVVNQTESDWECVCVDDGSTDGSGIILDEYATKDSRFRVFHQRNSGVSAARNVALSNITGEWICFLDSDDALHPRLFEKLKKYTIVSDEIDIVSYHQKCGKNNVLDVQNRADEPRIATFDLRKNIPLTMANSGICENIYRWRQAPDIRFQSYPIGEDKLFLAEWICRSRKVVFTNIEGYWYRTRQGSASNSSMTIEKIKSNFETGKGMLKLYASRYPRIDEKVIRGECVRISELTANSLSKIQKSPEKMASISSWCNELRDLSSLPNISRWFSLVFGVVGKFHFLWYALLVLPFRMKMLRNQLKYLVLSN